MSRCYGFRGSVRTVSAPPAPAPPPDQLDENALHWRRISADGENIPEDMRHALSSMDALVFEDLLYSGPMPTDRAKRIRAAIQEHYGATYGEIYGDMIRPDIDTQWTRIQGGPQADADAVESLDWYRREARFFYRWNEHYHGIIQAVIDHVVGPELRIKITVANDPDDDSKGANESEQRKLRGRWRRWTRLPTTKWRKRVREHARRRLRDGEAIWRKFIVHGDDGDGNSRTVQWRYVEPEHICDEGANVVDTSNVLYGVRFADGDAETPISYFIRGKQVPADQVLHFRENSDLNAVRGLPFLLTATRRIKNYGEWLTARLLLNKYRSYIVMVWSAQSDKGGTVAGGIAARATGSRTVSTISGPQTVPTQRVLPGSSITVPPGKTLEFKSPNINAADVKDDGRAILLSIAAACGLPEHIVTRDASNSNFASTLVAEAPGVATLLAIQEDICDDIRRVVIETLKEITDVPRDDAEYWNRVDVEVSGPSIIHRDELEAARANMIKVDAGVMSRATWAAKSNLDWAHEQREINNERDQESTERPDDRRGMPFPDPDRSRPAAKARGKDVPPGDKPAPDNPKGAPRGKGV